MDERKVIYSGIQPTGGITLGNYIGAVNNWLKLQSDPTNQCIYSIVDMHAMTVRQVPSEFRARVLSFFAQYLALGIDPEKSIVYIQSHVHEHAELTWILNCFTYIGEASRMTQFKDKSSKHADNVNMGLMDYPILMAADILLYNTKLVPIGIDQKQHLELARTLAERFNNACSPTFNVPEGFIPPSGAKIMSLQAPTFKMSKSDENDNATIYLLDSNEAIERKIKRAVTDSDGQIRLGEDKDGVTNLLTIYAACNNITVEQAVAYFCGMNYANLKQAVADSVIALVTPFKDNYNRLINDKDYLLKVAKDGAERASDIARKTLRKVYKKVGFVQY